MINRSIAATIATFALAACTHRDPTSVPGAGNPDLAVLKGAKLELVSDGGIAALQLRYAVDYDTRTYAYSQRHLCSDKCGAPLDTSSGTLSAATTDSLFSLVWAQSPYQLHDDYGTTMSAADMMTHTLRVTFDGNTKSVRADDGTMPDPMRRIVDATRSVVAAARPK